MNKKNNPMPAVFSFLISHNLNAYLTSEQWVFITHNLMKNQYACFKSKFETSHTALRTAKKAEQHANTPEEKESAKTASLSALGLFKKTARKVSLGLIKEFLGDDERVKKIGFIFR